MTYFDENQQKENEQYLKTLYSGIKEQIKEHICDVLATESLI
jgi:hypothetical protein